MINFQNPWDPDVNPPEWMKTKPSSNDVIKEYKELNSKSFNVVVGFPDGQLTLPNNKIATLNQLGNIFNQLLPNRIIVQQIKGGAFIDGPNLNLEIINAHFNNANARALFVRDALGFLGSSIRVIPNISNINEINNGEVSINEYLNKSLKFDEAIIQFIIEGALKSVIRQIEDLQRALKF